MRVAAVTMVYNEPIWARVWARHYAREVGAEHCLVLDHGSDDGSTADLGVRVERMARSVLDEDGRARLMSDCVAMLLRRYDVVVHSDADELLVADPRRYADLRAYAAEAREVVTAVGLDVLHLPDEEPALDVSQPLGAQRSWVRFSAAMCKPALVRRAVRWTPGFHSCDAPREIGPLYLLHLRYADLGAGLRRLARSRGLAFARPDMNLHQRVPDAVFDGMVRDVARLPRREGPLLGEDGACSPWLARMQAGWSRGDDQLGLSGDVLWRMPDDVRLRL